MYVPKNMRVESETEESVVSFHKKSKNNEGKKKKYPKTPISVSPADSSTCFNGPTPPNSSRQHAPPGSWTNKKYKRKCRKPVDEGAQVCYSFSREELLSVLGSDSDEYTDVMYRSKGVQCGDTLSSSATSLCSDTEPTVKSKNQYAPRPVGKTETELEWSIDFTPRPLSPEPPSVALLSKVSLEMVDWVEEQIKEKEYLCTSPATLADKLTNRKLIAEAVKKEVKETDPVEPDPSEAIAAATEAVAIDLAKKVMEESKRQSVMEQSKQQKLADLVSSTAIFNALDDHEQDGITVKVSEDDDENIESVQIYKDWSIATLDLINEPLRQTRIEEMLIDFSVTNEAVTEPSARVLGSIDEEEDMTEVSEIELVEDRYDALGTSSTTLHLAGVDDELPMYEQEEISPEFRSFVTKNCRTGWT